MKKLDFNSGWTFRKAEEPPAARAVTLPHDAMTVSYTHLTLPTT